MSKLRLRKAQKGILLALTLFLLSIFFDFIGYADIGKYTLYLTMVVIIYNMFNAAIFVSNSNKKFFKRIKNKQPIFTDSLTDDESDDSIK
ncbi:MULTISPECIES: hypothetical protein [unclassified Psychrobacter]|uniref:hypothetical protein n=1 Tax=unclassified Psychrobacter TaxID=196806 RepID=UPI00191A0D0F|nr:hypothetical protein [Psychrobacter sp. HII-4]